MTSPVRSRFARMLAWVRAFLSRLYGKPLVFDSARPGAELADGDGAPETVRSEGVVVRKGSLLNGVEVDAKQTL